MFPPFTGFFAGTGDQTQIACVAVLYANHYTMGPTEWDFCLFNCSSSLQVGVLHGVDLDLLKQWEATYFKTVQSYYYTITESWPFSFAFDLAAVHA